MLQFNSIRCHTFNFDTPRLFIEIGIIIYDRPIYPLRSTTTTPTRAKHTHPEPGVHHHQKPLPPLPHPMVLPVQELTQFKTREEQDQEIRVSERPVVGRTLTRGEFGR